MVDNLNELLTKSNNTIFIIRKEDNEKHYLKEIISGKSFISLRLIDWLLTHYAKNNNIQYWIDDDKNLIYKKLPNKIEYAAKLRKFNMHTDYRAQLKSFSKMFFDPFRRHERIIY